MGRADAAAVRKTLCKDLVPLSERLSDYKDHSLLLRSKDGKIDNTRWLEAVANILSGRSLANWRDEDLTSFRNEAQTQARRLKRWAMPLGKLGTGNRLGVFLVSSDGREQLAHVNENASQSFRTSQSL